MHHLKPFHLFPKLELDPANLITLCMTKKMCHLLIGHGDDFAMYNPNARLDAHLVLAEPERREEICALAKKNRIGGGSGA